MEILLKLGRLLRRPGEDVGDNPHRGFGRIDVGVANHELLQNVVLNGSGQLGVRHALFFRRNDIQGQDRQHRPVHRHRHRHLVQRDPVEQGPHVIDAVDGHARHADVALHPRVVGVIAPMRGQIEGDGQPLLPRRQIAAIEGVGFLGGREARVLPDRPRIARIHGRIRPAHERREPRQAVKLIQPVQRLRTIGGFDRQTLWRPATGRARAPARLRRNPDRSC